MENKAPLLNKETFCTALHLIGEQERINNEVSVALDKVSTGCNTFGCNNKYLTALLMVLKEAVNDKYDYIDWWLYESTDDYRVWTSDGSKEWYLKEPEALYDYIVEECQD